MCWNKQILYDDGGCLEEIRRTFLCCFTLLLIYYQLFQFFNCLVGLTGLRNNGIIFLIGSVCFRNNMVRKKKNFGMKAFSCVFLGSRWWRVLLMHTKRMKVSNKVISLLYFDWVPRRRLLMLIIKGIRVPLYSPWWLMHKQIYEKIKPDMLSAKKLAEKAYCQFKAAEFIANCSQPQNY